MSKEKEVIYKDGKKYKLVFYEKIEGKVNEVNIYPVTGEKEGDKLNKDNCENYLELKEELLKRCNFIHNI